jgi:hypothetical protein
MVCPHNADQHPLNLNSVRIVTLRFHRIIVRNELDAFSTLCFFEFLQGRVFVIDQGYDDLPIACGICWLYNNQIAIQNARLSKTPTQNQ